MPNMIVVLNKIDMIAEEKRNDTISKRVEGLKKVFSKTRFTDKFFIIIFFKINILK